MKKIFGRTSVSLPREDFYKDMNFKFFEANYDWSVVAVRHGDSNAENFLRGKYRLNQLTAKDVLKKKRYFTSLCETGNDGIVSHKSLMLPSRREYKKERLREYVDYINLELSELAKDGLNEENFHLRVSDRRIYIFCSGWTPMKWILRKERSAKEEILGALKSWFHAPFMQQQQEGLGFKLVDLITLVDHDLLFDRKRRWK